MAKIKRGPWNSLFLLYSAERLGFEPRVPVRVRRISSAVHSTTLASLPVCGCKGTNKRAIYKINHEIYFFIRAEVLSSTSQRYKNFD